MPGTVYKRGDIWWISFYYQGKKLRHSAHTKKKREAENLLGFFLGQVARSEFKGFDHRDGLRLFEMLDDFIADYIQRKKRDVSTTSYRANYLRAFFQDVPVEDITERKIDLYIKHRQKMKRSNTTINRELQLLGQAMRLAQRKKLLASVPHIEKFSEKENARQGFFEPHEMEAIVVHPPCLSQRRATVRLSLRLA